MRSLANDAFRHTARYDAAIAEWMAFDEGDFADFLTLEFEKAADLVYGENPHQRAAFYEDYGVRTLAAGTGRAAPRQGAVVQQPARPGRRAVHCAASSSCPRA